MNSKFIKTLLSGLILTVSCGMFSPTVADEVPAKLTMEKDIKIAEGHCMLMVSLRLGDGFEPTVTDRREGMNSENIPTFTYVGTAENKDSGEELSFICKFAMENGNYNITEFKIMTGGRWRNDCGKESSYAGSSSGSYRSVTVFLSIAVAFYSGTGLNSGPDLFFLRGN